MDNKLWQEYEAQHAELRRNFRRRRWHIFLWFLLYIAVSTAGIFLFVYPRWMEVAVFALIFNTAFSLFYTLFAINGKLKEEQAQRAILTEKAPVGKIRLQDESCPS